MGFRVWGLGLGSADLQINTNVSPVCRLPLDTCVSSCSQRHAAPTDPQNLAFGSGYAVSYKVIHF